MKITLRKTLTCTALSCYALFIYKIFITSYYFMSWISENNTKRGYKTYLKKNKWNDVDKANIKNNISYVGYEKKFQNYELVKGYVANIRNNKLVDSFETDIQNNSSVPVFETNFKKNQVDARNKITINNSGFYKKWKKKNDFDVAYETNTKKIKLDVGDKTNFKNNYLNDDYKKSRNKNRLNHVGYKERTKYNVFSISNKTKTENNNVNIISKTNKKVIDIKLKMIQSKPIKITQNIRTDWTDMIKVHQNIYNKFTDKELQNYFAQERISNKLFENPLDITSDFNLLKSLFPNPIEHRDRVIGQLLLKLKTNETKIILTYNQDIISNAKLKKCNVNKCIVKTNISELSSADVVLFESSHSLRTIKKHKKNQVWILYQLESPLNSAIQVAKNLINWTATYRRDSVISTPYERFTPYLNVSKFPKNPLRNYALNKTKSVAWFVSNCADDNGRSILAKKLSKYIKVDIYGLCGTLECQRSDVDCFKKLKREYKFYLSFENSNCKDYVTEKLFWNAYENDVVPVVMGAHPNEYKRIAPPHSYIHVDDFPSVKDLAKYLNFLDQNDIYYNQYFLWKNTGSFIDTKFTCRLCAMAHLAPMFPMWYSNLNSWWSETCLVNTKIASWKNEKEIKSYAKHIKYGYKRK
ncbi:glycoprotein 3-alpha-L-fucosyltransferase A isoform X1 [Hydra vulgaris]|uniref:glycoprotein 3-alpha-L-fucosyltransferase A isoform X1 n=1 Tax=Hydra vulgaris TaxID=6087 RepID=UPI001F5EBAAC|nr:glycoprotein 3-alpha-L-fucosyltransferase A-like isoform X1 [Hydra vulgaris]